MSVNIKPLEDRIVVKPLDAEQTTASGLVIPDTAKEKPQEGEVVAVGPGRFNEDGDDLALLRLLLGGVRDDQAGSRGLLGVERLDDDAVLERLDGDRHVLPPLRERRVWA